MTENISKSTSIRVGVQDDHFLQKNKILTCFISCLVVPRNFRPRQTLYSLPSLLAFLDSAVCRRVCRYGVPRIKSSPVWSPRWRKIAYQVLHVVSVELHKQFRLVGSPIDLSCACGLMRVHFQYCYPCCRVLFNVIVYTRRLLEFRT